MITRAALLGKGPLATTAQAQDQVPPRILSATESARQACQQQGRGIWQSDLALTRPDLNDDGAADWMLDPGEVPCSDGRNMFCGSGGCSLHFGSGSQVTERLAHGWGLIDMGNTRIILLFIHGGNCGGFGYTACAEAIVWSDGGFQSLANKR